MPQALHLFEAWGIELEYMIVDRETLAVRPVADRLLEMVCGEPASDYEAGRVAWSNELVLHVVELKTNGPTPSLAGWTELFQADVRRIDELLAPLGARLMPTAMHPTMDPLTETRLWPHENGPVYQAYDRIFGCTGHGWSNLQSCHVNLPFHGDEEFGRLHAAVRAVLPLLPALAGSSPVEEGRVTGSIDTRLEHYRRNQRRVPSVAGGIVPEPVWTREDYEHGILARIYRDIAGYDTEGILRREFLNSRGAIARFDRDAIEIRLLDLQECPLADLAVSLLVGRTVRALVAETWAPLERLRSLEVDPLRDTLLDAAREGERAVVDHGPLLEVFGLPAASTTAAAVWRHLADVVLREVDPGEEELADAAHRIVRAGPLSRRMLAALGPAPDALRIRAVYGDLCDCLAEGRLYAAGS